MDSLIVDIAERRDRSGFTKLFEHYGPRIKAYLMKRGTPVAAADELLQDVMLTVWNKADRFDPGRAAASTWIFTIARNKHIDHIRKERRPEPEPDDPIWTPSTGPGPDERLEAQQQREKLRDALTALPQEQAQILQHAYFEGKSLSAIAAHLDLPLGTVKTRARLAMSRLRKAITPMEPAR